MKKIPANWLRIAGGSLGLFGVLFVAFRLHSQAEQIDFARLTKVAWSVMFFLAIFYGMANILLARAWWHLLVFFSVTTRFKWAVKAYGISQIAKYVPGNIFHVAGRQSLGMAAGYPMGPLLKSAMWELGMLAFGGATYAALILPVVFKRFSPLLSIAIFLLVLAIVWFILHNWLGTLNRAAFFLQLFFLAVTGVGFSTILALVAPSAVPLLRIPALCGAYVIAWLIGFVTPGAPAGIGVRELMLFFLLGERVEQADLLLAVVLARVVTMVGDFFYFAASTIIKPTTVNRTM